MKHTLLLSLLCLFTLPSITLAAESTGKSAPFSLDLSGSTEYIAWLTEHFTEQQRTDASLIDENADPDGDGQNNGFEFLAKLDPMDSNSRFSLFIGDSSGDYLRIGPIVDGVTYEIEYSADLFQWNSVDSSLHEIIGNELQIDLSSLPENSFYRVSVSDGVASTSSTLTYSTR
ncbi:MAG: hypothetical protein ACI92G_003710 [Candidatus Pelagisphaera sp.]|jgi:hypothetical protein